MKKFRRALAMAALLALATLALPAADKPADKKKSEKPAREGGEKRLGEEWKKLSPAEREAKREEIKARLEKRVAELREKKEKKTITQQEEHDLTRSEQILKRFETMESKGSPLLRGGTTTPAAPAPPEK